MTTYDDYRKAEDKLKKLGDRYWNSSSEKPSSAPRCQCFNCIGVRTVVDATCHRVGKLIGSFSSVNHDVPPEDVERVQSLIYDIAIERLQECWGDVSRRLCEKKPKPKVVA